jgi:hypothetical protein
VKLENTRNEEGKTLPRRLKIKNTSEEGHAQPRRVKIENTRDEEGKPFLAAQK